ncbi:hypothetical protein HDU97_007213 [Phlyctochytrium planicorne]|nr:hypothetical protein HDU97_007213 [Phlyctochytrium planicorne]
MQRLHGRTFATFSAVRSSEIIKLKEDAMAEAKKWLKSNAQRFRTSDGSGRANFVGKDGKPFPMNKYFVPITPLNDGLREEIYQRFKKDSKGESPLKLAQEYGLSIARVNAILRLKALEKKNAREDVPIQVHLTKGMERLLAVHSSKRLREKPFALSAERLKPLFQLVDEDTTMDPEDAAELLDLEPYANRDLKLNLAAERIASSPSDIKHSAPLLRKNTFMLSDTSDPAVRALFFLPS